MSTNKIIQALGSAAGSAGGAGLNVEEVFSTYLYDPTGSSMTITNDIDLAGEGGLVWLKNRASDGHHLFDTERGATYDLRTNETSAQSSIPNSLTSFNSNGFSIGNYTEINSTNQPVASWTWRKAPGFFDVVTYTGDGTSSRQISHDLGTTVGMTVVKCTSNSGYWHVLHRSNNAAKTLYLNRTDAEVNDTYAWNSTHATSTHFTVGAGLNSSGRTYVAYLFAHNDGDGEFGPDADQDIIKCGSYTGTNASGNHIDLGFEPQWLLIKAANASGTYWLMYDNMRGVATGGNDAYLFANVGGAEDKTFQSMEFTATGFQPVGGWTQNNDPYTYIYVAIRRGPMAAPESATDVFYVEEANNPNKFVTTGFVTDLALQKHTALSSSWYLADRLRGENRWLSTNTNGADLVGTDSTYYTGWDYMNGVDMNIYASQSNDHIFHMWKRAPNYFDVVAYTGNSTAGRTVSHNLGVAPEMMWVKKRNGTADWTIYHKDLGATKYIEFSTFAAATNSARWNDTAPTSSVFSLGNHSNTNISGDTYIAYLFASLDGVSKVGSFTTTGGAVNVDCGFSSGARFVLLKSASGTDANLYNWELYDTARGIVAGNDSVLFSNSPSAEYTGNDYIDPYSAGFTFNSGEGGRPSGQTIIFYAIA